MSVAKPDQKISTDVDHFRLIVMKILHSKSIYGSLEMSPDSLKSEMDPFEASQKHYFRPVQHVLPNLFEDLSRDTKRAVAVAWKEHLESHWKEHIFFGDHLIKQFEAHIAEDEKKLDESTLPNSEKRKFNEELERKTSDSKKLVIDQKLDLKIACDRLKMIQEFDLTTLHWWIKK